MAFPLPGFPAWIHGIALFLPNLMFSLVVILVQLGLKTSLMTILRYPGIILTAVFTPFTFSTTAKENNGKKMELSRKCTLINAMISLIAQVTLCVTEYLKDEISQPPGRLVVLLILIVTHLALTLVFLGLSLFKRQRQCCGECLPLMSQQQLEL